MPYDDSLWRNLRKPKNWFKITAHIYAQTAHIFVKTAQTARNDIFKPGIYPHRFLSTHVLKSVRKMCAVDSQTIFGSILFIFSEIENHTKALILFPLIHRCIDD